MRRMPTGLKFVRWPSHHVCMHWMLMNWNSWDKYMIRGHVVHQTTLIQDHIQYWDRSETHFTIVMDIGLIVTWAFHPMSIDCLQYTLQYSLLIVSDWLLCLCCRRLFSLTLPFEPVSVQHLFASVKQISFKLFICSKHLVILSLLQPNQPI